MEGTRSVQIHWRELGANVGQITAYFLEEVCPYRGEFGDRMDRGTKEHSQQKEHRSPRNERGGSLLSRTQNANETRLERPDHGGALDEGLCDRASEKSQW